MIKLSHFAALAIATGSSNQHHGEAQKPSPYAQTSDETQVQGLFNNLLAAENRRDARTVRAMFTTGPDTLFVGKSPSGVPDAWQGFWGASATNQLQAVLEHGGFNVVKRDPLRLSTLSHDVIQLYAPVTISVTYGGQTGAPKPFILMLYWVRSGRGWKIATDVAVRAD